MASPGGGPWAGGVPGPGARLDCAFLIRRLPDCADPVRLVMRGQGQPAEGVVCGHLMNLLSNYTLEYLSRGCGGIDRAFNDGNGGGTGLSVDLNFLFAPQ